jgi:DinB superfamily
MKETSSLKLNNNFMRQDRGFLNGEADVRSAMKQLAQYIETIPEELKAITEQEILQFRAAGKWSRKQILGHLIDSAINNLQRFTDIQFLPLPYIVQPYMQDELVLVNQYQQLPLNHLLQLWQALNRQIIFIVENIPDEKFDYPVNPQYNNKEMKTLGWLICDYVAHMEHHHKQLRTS